MTRLLYFAYGSNIHPARLQERIGNTAPVGVARVRGYDLQFNKRGSDGSGKCNIVVTGRRADHVLGTIYEVSLAQFKDLMQHEPGYRPSAITVEIESQVHAAATFVANADRVDDGLVPFEWYHRMVVSGLNHFDFPVEYIERVHQVTSVPDSEQSRAADIEETLARISEYQEPALV